VKSSDMDKIQALSRLRTAYDLLSNPSGLDSAQRNAMLKIRHDLNYNLLSPHWDKCNELITEDDS
jgi:hypothetical protein